MHHGDLRRVAFAVGGSGEDVLHAAISALDGDDVGRSVGPTRDRRPAIRPALEVVRQDSGGPFWIHWLSDDDDGVGRLLLGSVGGDGAHHHRVLPRCVVANVDVERCQAAGAEAIIDTRPNLRWGRGAHIQSHRVIRGTEQQQIRVVGDSGVALLVRGLLWLDDHDEGPATGVVVDPRRCAAGAAFTGSPDRDQVVTRRHRDRCSWKAPAAGLAFYPAGWTK